MNWRNIFSRKKDKNTDERLKVKNHDGVYTIDMLSGISSTYSAEKALSIEAFYACVRDKSESIGQLPLCLYEYNRENGRKRIKQGRSYKIFTQQPCDYVNMQQFLQMIVATLETEGAFYAYPVYNDRGSLMDIVPFKDQGNITPNMDYDGSVFYTYVTNDQKPIYAGRREDLFIVDNFSLDGYRPVRPIHRQARLLGIADSLDETQQAQTEDGITSQMALSTDALFSDEDAQERLRNSMDKARGPNGKKHIPIFEQGLKPISLRLTPQELELLGNKEFTAKSVCRMVRVPPYRIGLETITGQKRQDLDESYMTNELNPILTKIEYEFNRFTPDGYRVQFDRKAYYAGSPHRLVEAVEREVKGGLATINEGREDLGREPIEGGDIFAIDNNNCTYGQWTEVKEIQERLYGSANNQNNEGNNDEN